MPKGLLIKTKSKRITIKPLFFLFLILPILLGAFSGALFVELDGFGLIPQKDLDPQVLGVSSPNILSFQGRVTDLSDTPITASTSLTFKLYNVSSGGTALWTGSCNVTPDQDGVFDVLLGEECGSAIPETVFSENTDTYLGITVGSDSEMSPRQRVSAAAYAINADTLDGFDSSQSPVANEVVVLDSDGYLSFGITDPQISSGSDIILSPTDNVGIGTTDPLSLFSVGSSSQFRVSSTGDLTRIKDLAYTWPSAHPGTGDTGFLRTDDSGSLSWVDMGAAGVWGTSDVGTDYSAYMSSVGIGTFDPFTLDEDDDRLSIHSDQMEGGLSVYSSYATTGGTWPLVAFKADSSNYEGAILGLTQDGTGDILQGYSGSTFSLQIDRSGDLHLASNGIAYVEPFSSLPASGDLSPNTGEGCLYASGGSLYWDSDCSAGSPVALGGAGLWSENGSNIYFNTGYVGIGTDAPTKELEVSGDVKASGTVSATNVGVGTDSPEAPLSVGSSSDFKVESDGDVSRIKGLDYVWPSSLPTAGNTGYLKSTDAGSLNWEEYGGAAGGYCYADTIYYTSSGTFEKSNYGWLRAIKVTAVGGGGAGAGLPAGTGARVGGSGGGAGISFITDISGLSSSVTVTVGTGGAGVVNADGNRGGDSSFGSYVQGSGGSGGHQASNRPQSPGGGTGDFVVRGGFGNIGIVTGTGYGEQIGGQGGESYLAGTVTGYSLSSGTQYAREGQLYGGGGGGAANRSGAALAGGDGADGIVIIDLYADCSSGTTTAYVDKTGDTMTGDLMFHGGTRYLGTDDDNRLAFKTNDVEKMTILSNGNVGIGISAPETMLEISGTNSGANVLNLGLRNTAEVIDSATNMYFMTGSGSVTGSNTTAFIRSSVTQADPSALKGNLQFYTNNGDTLSTAMTIDDTGYLGIGDTNPSSELDVAGDINFTGNITEDGVEIFTGVIAAFNGSCPTGWTEYTDAQGRAIIGAGQGDGLTNRTLGSTGGEEEHTLTLAEMPSHSHSMDSAGAHTHTGRVDNLVSSGSNNYRIVGWSHSGGITFSGAVASAGSHTHTINNAGSDAAHNNMQPYIALTYCQKQTGSDYAEWIPSNEQLEPATIVSIDLSKDETITASSKEYDSNVVGIVTTQPGWVIGEESNQSEAMALSGRVPVKVSLKNGNIQRGDPITTSSIKGVGMKATKTGPIIGKAMEELNNESNLYECTDSKTNQTEKCGTITVFVNPTMHIQESFVLGTTDSNKGFLNGLAEVIGQITGTIIKTSINVLGATDSKVSTEDILSRIERLEENQQSQALILKEKEDGSIELLGGKIIVEGDGTVNIKRLAVKEDYSTGSSSILSGETSVTIPTKAVTEVSNVFITPTSDTLDKQLYVTDRKEGQSFEVNIREAIDIDITFDWFIVEGR
jgi:microcystin-dependent protein